MKFRPLGDRVLVKALEAKEVKKGGIIIPDTAKEKPQEGMAVAIGPGRWDEDGKKRVEMEVSLGDKVVFAKYSGSEIKLNEKKYLIMSEKDILAVIDK